MKQQYQSKHPGRNLRALIMVLGFLLTTPSHAALSSYSFIWSESYIQTTNNTQPASAAFYNFSLSLNFGNAADAGVVTLGGGGLGGPISLTHEGGGLESREP